MPFLREAASYLIVKDGRRYDSKAIAGAAHGYPWRRMRQYRASWSGPDTFFADRSWADCTTSMSGLDLRQAQAFTKLFCRR
jgi:hypothetical protein